MYPGIDKANPTAALMLKKLFPFTQSSRCEENEAKVKAIILESFPGYPDDLMERAISTFPFRK